MKGTTSSRQTSGMGLSDFPNSLQVLILLRVLPERLPFHPHRWWIHCRMVYLPMSYLYEIRFQAKEADLILSLREVRLSNDSPDEC